MFDGRTPRNTSGRTRDVGGWTELRNKQFFNVYYAPSFTLVTKSRRMKWAGAVRLVGARRRTYRVRVGKSEGDIAVDLGMDRKLL